MRYQQTANAGVSLQALEQQVMAGPGFRGMNACVACCDRWAEGDRTALTWFGNCGAETGLSYRALATNAARFANLLAARGVGPGDVVAGLLPRGAELLTVVLGTWRAGAVYLPLATTMDAAAIDGQDALQLWRQRRHGVVLLDIHMPGMDGFAVARAIRSEEAAAGLPRCGLVAVTANALKGEDERCYAAGMDGFVAKPVSLAALSRTLARWIPGLQAEGAPSGTATGAVFDPARLRELFGDDPARLASLFESFADSAARDLDALGVADTPARMAEAAHRLKGAARVVGARLVAEQAARTEAVARTGDFAAARATAGGLADLLARTADAARANFAAVSE